MSLSQCAKLELKCFFSVIVNNDVLGWYTYESTYGYTYKYDLWAYYIVLKSVLNTLKYADLQVDLWPGMHIAGTHAHMRTNALHIHSTSNASKRYSVPTELVPECTLRVEKYDWLFWWEGVSV